MKYLKIFSLVLILISIPISSIQSRPIPSNQQKLSLSNQFKKILTLTQEYDNKLKIITNEKKDEFETTESFKNKQMAKIQNINNELDVLISRDTINVSLSVKNFNYNADSKIVELSTKQFYFDSLASFRNCPINVATIYEDHVKFNQVSRNDAIFKIILYTIPVDSAKKLKSLVDKRKVIFDFKAFFNFKYNNILTITFVRSSLINKENSSLISAPPLPFENLWRKAKDLESKNENIEAIELISKIIDLYPEFDEAPFKIAQIYTHSLKNYEKGIQYYRMVVNKFPKSKFAPKSLFMIGYFYSFGLENNEKARETFNEFLKTYPNHKLVQSVKWELSNLRK